MLIGLSSGERYNADMDNSVPPGVQDFMAGITDQIINPIVGIIFALALVYFLYGLVSFIFSAGNEQKRADGKQHMVWGTIGMTIMVSVFGLLQLVLFTFSIQGDKLPAELPLNSVFQDF